MQKQEQATTAGETGTDSCRLPSGEVISGEHWRYCPQCGQELINEKCKLRRPRCHYFMSCSDFDFAG